MTCAVCPFLNQLLWPKQWNVLIVRTRTVLSLALGTKKRKVETPEEHQNLVPETGEEQMLSNWKSTIVLNWAINHHNHIRSDHSSNSVCPSFFFYPHLSEIEVLFCPETTCCMSPRPSPSVLIFKTCKTFGWNSLQPQEPEGSCIIVVSFAGLPNMELLQVGSWWLMSLVSCLAHGFHLGLWHMTRSFLQCVP